MTTPNLFAASGQPPVDREASWFARQWLCGSAHRAVRTGPVVAVVQELADVLRDDQIPAPQAMLAARRAVRLLSALTAGTRVREDARREHGHPDGFVRVLDQEDVARSVESTRFASSWLLGDPAEAIRTQPVIALVEVLLNSMLDAECRPQEVYDSLCRVVRVLSVLVREDVSSTTKPAA